MNFSTLSLAAPKKLNRNHLIKTCTAVFCTVLMLAGLNSFAQTATDGDFRTRSTGALNWSGTTTWQVRTSATWANTTSTPTASSNVYIQAGSVVTVDVAIATCNDLHVSTTGVVTIGANTLQVNGKLRAYTGTAVFTTGVDAAFYSGQTSSNSPGVNSITSTPGVGKLSIVGNSRSVTATGEWGATTTGYDQDIAMNAGQIATLGTNVKAANWIITSGTLDANSRSVAADNGTTGGNITIALGATLTTSVTGSSTNVFQRAANTPGNTLTVNGTLIFTGAAPRVQMTTYALNGTVQYAAAGVQTLATNGGGTTAGNIPLIYTNLTLATSGVKTTVASQTTTVNGTLSLQGTATLALGTSAVLTYGSSAILEYKGSAIQTAAIPEWPASGGPNNVNVNNSNGFRFQFSRSLTGNFRVLSGDVQNLSGAGVTLTMTGTADTLQVNGSITGTNVGSNNDMNLVYSGAGTLTVNGSGSLCRFLNATVNTGSTLALFRSFEVMFGTFAVNGTLSMNGGGFVSSNANTVGPTYGASSTLNYNATYTTTSREFPATGVKNVTITHPSATSVVTLDGDKTITGTLAVGTHTLNGGKSMNAAAITISTGSMVMGDITTSASFTCSGASSISLTGTWTVTGFVKSTSTVTFTGTGTLASATNFYNLTNSGGTRSITANIDVENTLLVSGGQMGVTGGSGKSLTMSGATATINITTGSIFGTDAGAGNDLSLIISGTQTTLTGNATGVNDDEKKFFNVTVNSGSKLILARGILCKYGTFTVTGTLQINANGYVNTSPAYGINAKTPAYNATTGTLVYNNGGPYTTAGEWPTASTPPNVSLIAVGTNVTLNGDRTISGVLTLTEGKITTSTNTLIITATGVGAIVRTNGYVFGNLRRGINGASTVLYPIGDASNYTPLTLVFGAGTGSGLLTASTTVPNAAPAAGAPPTGSGISQTKYINRFWSLTNSTVATPSYSATFTYIDPTDVAGSANTNALIVGQNNGGTWSNPGVTSSVSPSVTTATGLSTFGDFYLGEGSCAAPSSLNYTNNTVVYCRNVAITPNSPSFTGDAATSYTVSPALPTGLSFNTTTGVITGTPTVATAAANYLVTVFNACGNTTRNVNITISAPPALSFSKTMASSCGGGADGTITVGATGNGPFTYSWTSTPPGYTANTAMITGLSPRDYTVVVTDANSCTAFIPDITIWQAQAPTHTHNAGNPSSCGNTGAIAIYGANGVGPYTYSIDNVNYQSSNSFTGLSAGTYNLNVKDLRGCTGTPEQLILVGGSPISVTAYTRPAKACGSDGSIELYRTGGIPPYTYSINDVTYFSSNTFFNLASGTYTGWVKDASGCKGSLPGITVAQTAAVTGTATSSNTSPCSNTGYIEIHPGGGNPGYTYSIDNTNYQSSNAFTGLAAGTYSARVKDSKNCLSGFINVTIGTDPASVINVTANVTPTSSCANTGAIQLFRTGGVGPYTYSLDDVTYQVSNMFTGKAAGTYTGWVKDSRGCKGSLAGITVTTAPAVGVTEVHGNASACANNGAFQLRPSGGKTPYTYSKDDLTYQGSDLFTGLAPGMYTGWVMDAYGCKASVAVNIGQDAPINVTAYAKPASSCASTNGSIQLFRTGGLGPYTYSLDNITYQTSNMFSNLSPNTYDGYVKDSRGCVGMLGSIFVGPNCAKLITVTKNNPVKDNAVKGMANDAFTVQAYPNPSSNEFTLVLPVNTTDRVTITVTDLTGRKVYQTTGIVKQQYRFGMDLNAGIYFVQVIQGDKQKTIKLVKE